MANRLLIRKFSSYVPHILDGGQGQSFSGRREKLYRSEERGILPWYQTWVIRNGVFHYREQGQLRKEFGPHILVIPPGHDLELLLPPGTEYHWIEWGIRHAELGQPRDGIRLHYKPYRRRQRLQAPAQPSPQEVWGLEFPTRLPSELYDYSNRMIAQIANEWWQNPLGLAMANAYLGQWLVHVVRVLSSSASQTPVLRDGPDWLREAEQVLRQNLVNISSTQEWAKRLGLREHQFRLRCLDACQSTPKQLMNRIRLEQAQTLLVASDLNITELAARCGYPSRTSFTRWFKQQSGLSPSAWAEQASRSSGAC